MSSPRALLRFVGAVLSTSCLLLAQSCGTSVEPSAPGDPDGSFANQGLFTLAVDAVPTDAYARFATTDAGGNVWVAGWAAGDPVTAVSASNAVLVRLRADGTLDTGLAGSGYVLDPPEPVTSPFTGYAGLRVAPVAGGGAVLVEAKRGSPCKFPPNCGVDGITLRVDLGGAVDKSYGNAGRSAAVLQSMFDAVADSRGGIVLVGTGLPSSPDPRDWLPYRKELARVDGQGHVDAEFAARATGALDCPGLSVQDARGAKIALQPDGKLLVAQTYYRYLEPGSSRVCVSRIHPDGTLDVGYGGSGRVQLADPLVAFDTKDVLGVFGAGDGSATLAFSKQAGQPGLYTYSYVVVALTPQGTVDPARYVRGYAGRSDSRIAQATAVALQDDGKVLVAGFPGIGVAPSWQGVDTTQPRLERLGLDGQPDPTFGSNGQGYQSLVLSGHALDARHIHVAGTAIFVSGAAQSYDAAGLPGRSYFAVAKLVAR
jgi:uncharacterized delta-60 repeat protein